MLLTDAGLRVHVVESSAVAGGRARSWRDPGTGTTVDIGPHILLNKYGNFRALMRRLDTEKQVMWQADQLLTVLDKRRHIPIRMGGLPAPFHYARNLWRVLPSVSFNKLLSTVPLAWRTMRSSTADLLALDGVSALDHLRSAGVHEDLIQWFWSSASYALLNVPLERASAMALMRIFMQMLGHNDVAFGLQRVGLSELHADPAVRCIAEGKGNVHLGHGARELIWEEGRPGGVRLDDGSVLLARHVVLAVPPSVAAELLPAGHTLKAAAARFQPSPYLSVYTWLDRKITSTRSWARPWNTAALNTDFYELSNIRSAGTTGPGAMVASNIIWSDRVRDLPDAEIQARTMDEIIDFAPEAANARVVHQAVHYIPMAVPCAFTGMEGCRPTTRQADGLLVAGDWTDTGLPFCMESAARSGALAAETVLAERGAARVLALPVPRPQGLMRVIGADDRPGRAWDEGDLDRWRNRTSHYS